MGTRGWLPLAAGALFLGGCFEQDAPARSSILPLDFESTYAQVRGCRLNPGHESAYIRVRANPEGVAAYQDGVCPLPAGSVLVAEKHFDPDCTTLAGFYLRHKEQPGYDTENGDWHWQRLDRYREVLEDGRVEKCASCHRANCSDRDYSCSPP